MPLRVGFYAKELIYTAKSFYSKEDGNKEF